QHEFGHGIEIFVDQRRVVDQRYDNRGFPERQCGAGGAHQRRTGEAFAHGETPGSRTGTAAIMAALPETAALTLPLRPRRTEEAVCPFAHLLRIVPAHALVADAIGELSQPLFQLGTPLRRIENAARGLP